MADKVTARNIDFSGVKEGGEFNTRRMPAGDYLGKVVKCVDGEVKKGDNAGQFQWTWTIQLVNHPSAKFPYRTPFVDNQLWKLRNLLVSAGLQVPQQKLKVDPNRVLNRTIGVTLEDDEYEGKEKSQISQIFPATDLTGEQVADDEPDDQDEDVPDEELDVDETDEGDEFDEMDRAALKSYIKGQDADATFRKSESDDDLRARARAFGDDEEEEEEEPAPPPKKAAAKKAPAKAAPAAKKAAKKAPAPPPDDDDDLDELDLDEEL